MIRSCIATTLRNRAKTAIRFFVSIVFSPVAFFLAFCFSTVFPADSGIFGSEIRTLEGTYLRLRTDLPSSTEVDGLPAVFDAAVPLWCRFLGISPNRCDGWKMDGCLIGDFERFERAGLVREVPDLRTGFQLNRKLWVLEQASAYYRRHLLLHEGVHGLMAHVFHGLGPPWYAEGCAELLATHTLRDGKLEIGVIPGHRDEVPMWGRIKLIRDDIAAGKGRSLRDVLGLQPGEYDAPNAYAWSWALCVFLEGQPEFTGILGGMTNVLPPGRTTSECAETFNERFYDRIGRDVRSQWEAAWIDFAGRLDYGYDRERARIDDLSPGATRWNGRNHQWRVRPDRGWQNSGLRIQQGDAVRIAAAGRFRLGNRPATWWSDPNGITIRYDRGRPIGELQMTILPGPETSNANTAGDDYSRCPFLNPVSIGTHCEYTAPVGGTLFFRINDSPADLADNDGDVTVSLEKASGNTIPGS